MLIRDAELDGIRRDVRVADGLIAAIGERFALRDDEALIDAQGQALLPGLHDHHLHFLAFAAALGSVQCGPPQVADERALIEALHNERQRLLADSPPGWLRGIGYHASVAGDIDRAWLDRVLPDIPARIQQRSGRLWILNSLALAQLGDLDISPLEKIDGVFTGRLYDADSWLRERIGTRLPPVRRASMQLARYGITGFTDTSPHNSIATWEQFGALQRSGELLQRVVLMGDATLHETADVAGLRRGPHKLHLHESELPEFDAMCAAIAASHAARRPVAIHCVTLIELVFSLNALEAVGSIDGDRIEHAAVVPPDLLDTLRRLRVRVVTQPNFIAERGDAYLRDVEPVDVPWLYRLRGLSEAGIPVAAGTDTPFGAADPWAAMQAAVTRRSAGGAVIGADEALSPRAALALFLSDPLLPGHGIKKIEAGAVADLCLLDRDWTAASADLSAVRVRATLKSGEVIWSQQE